MKNKRMLVWAMCLCAVFIACGENEEDEDQPINQQPGIINPPPVISAGDSTKNNEVSAASFTDYQMGDIIFQTTSGKFMLPIQQATGSDFTHCGLVAVGKNGNVFVIEAYDSVMRTPIDAWVKRGVNGKFAVLRLKQRNMRMSESAQVKLKHQAKTYLGLPYDSYYGWGDDKMYCSELVYKLMNAAGIVLCKQRALKDYDLSSAQVKKALQQVYKGNVPYSEQMVAPADIMGSTELETIYSN
ncbi:MAG: YiiX/YebB-like N1pC/P60 family cysteine hydrolase [Flavobacteriales bacterium]